MMGSLAAGMAHYARLIKEEARKDDVLAVARRSANFLISRSEPPGTPWEYYPPTFWDGVNRDIHPVFTGDLMTSEPAETGMCYLDLYETSRDTVYLGAALRIGRTYVKTQLPQGTWYQRIDTKTGKPREAAMFAALLFLQSGVHPEFLPGAVELLRWAEDSFFVWDRTDPVLTAFWFKPNTRWNGNDPYFGSDWFVPCAGEQYAFFRPINGSSADFIDAFADAFRATGDTVYLAKAVALANTLAIAQRYWGGGEIPTHLCTVMPELNWMICSLFTAMSVLRNADLLNSLPAGRGQKTAP